MVAITVSIVVVAAVVVAALTDFVVAGRVVSIVLLVQEEGEVRGRCRGRGRGGKQVKKN